MGWALGLNGRYPGAKWDTPWGKMGCVLWLNVVGPEAISLGLGLNGWYHGAKWDMPWAKMGTPWVKMGCALGLNMLGTEAKWFGPWG